MMTNKNTGFWTRLIANLIDSSLVSIIIVFVLNQIIIGSNNVQDLVKQIIESFAFIFLPLFIFGIFYTSIFTHLFQASIGKLIVGLKVTDTNNNKLSFRKNLLRHTIGYQFSMILFGLGFLSIFKDPENRAWHDKISGSKVVNRATLWPIGLIVLIGLMFGNYYIATLLTKSIQSNVLLKSDAANLISQQAQEAIKNSSGVNNNFTPGIYSDTNSAYVNKYSDAKKYIDSEDFVNAKRSAESMLELATSSVEKANAYILLSYIYDIQEDYKNSLLNAKKAVDEMPSFAPAQVQLSFMYYVTGDIELAQEHASKAIEKDKYDPEAHFVMSLILMELDQADEAIKEINTAISLDPTNKKYKDTLTEMLD